jgi:ATP-dependent DNA helicase PIF1
MGDVATKKVLRTVFNAQNTRDKCSQEIAHLVASHPMVCCTHNFVHVNLTSRLRKVITGAGEEGGEENTAFKKNIVDAYEQLRLNLGCWERDSQAIIPSDQELRSMAPSTFYRTYTLNKHGRIVRRARSELAVIMYSPTISSDPNRPSYWQYCWVSLRKYKPYSGDQESLYGGSSADGVHKLDIDREEPPEDIKNRIISAWEHFLLERRTADDLTLYDGLVREVDRLKQRDELAELVQEGEILSGDAPLDADRDNPLGYEELCEHLFEIEMERSSMEWAVDHNFSNPNHQYLNGEFTVDYVKQQWDRLRDADTNGGNNDDLQAPRQPIDLRLCRAQQLQAVLVWKYINEQWPMIRQQLLDDTQSAQDGLLDNVLVVKGYAGVGKSFTIDVMIQETLNLPGNDSKKVLVMAPTGRAALNAHGVTLHSKDGLEIPINNGRATAKDFADDSSRLQDLQARFQNVCAVIIDEYSMVSLTDLYWINRRLQQAKVSDLPFGGIPVCFAGDPGQLPPVLALSLWAQRNSKNQPLSGNAALASDLYRRIKYVVNLEEVIRQSNPDDVGFLAAVRNGTVDDRWWAYINGKCTEDNQKRRLGGEVEFTRCFKSDRTIHIYFTNIESEQHNTDQVKVIGRPINRINAGHDCPSSASRSAETTQRLPPVLYLCENAKVMLLRNVWTKKGLVNGSTGVVKDFIYAQGVTAPSLPYAIVIEFADYSGPPFFSGEEKAKWVPLLTEECTWGGESNGQMHYRRSFPIALAYAITAWKSQGLTITDYICVRLGDKEPEHGATYVVFSRTQDLNMICIGPGVGLDRLTTKITNGRKLKERLKEDERLDGLSKSTEEYFRERLEADKARYAT